MKVTQHVSCIPFHSSFWSPWGTAKKQPGSWALAYLKIHLQGLVLLQYTFPSGIWALDNKQSPEGSTRKGGRSNSGSGPDFLPRCSLTQHPVPPACMRNLTLSSALPFICQIHASDAWLEVVKQHISWLKEWYGNRRAYNSFIRRSTHSCIQLVLIF